MKRILSCDGGGIRGILSASFLAALGPVPWDMIAGTSIGGIIAVGIAHGILPATILDMLVNKGSSIFGHAAPGLLEAKYDPASLEAELLSQFGNTTLSQLTTPLLVPTCELNSADVLFFKSWKAAGDRSYEFALKDVARATSAAPTYFPVAEIENALGNTFRCVDGGMAVNNPTLAVALEARAMWPDEPLAILSLGTGGRVTPIMPGNNGLIGWALEITTAFMDFSVSPTDHLTRLIPNATVVRVDADLPSNVNTAFDDASPANIAALCGLAQTLVAAHLEEAKKVLV